MTQATGRMLGEWASLPPRAEIDVAAILSALALDVVGRALFSADLTGEAARLNRALSANPKVALLATLRAAALRPALGPRAHGRRPDGRPLRRDGPVGRLIADRRRERDPVPGRRDLLDVLLTARFDDGSSLTDTEIGDELATFMLAGHETSAVTLSWALALLSAFPATPASGWRPRLTRYSAAASRRPPTPTGCPGRPR
jgi:cytochrome P450